MPFYEVIYETGEYSIMQCDSDEEALSGVAEQHRRAMSGQAGGPGGWPATRVARVLKYDDHPGELLASGMVSVKDAKAAVDSVAMGDQVSVWEVSAAMRDLCSPLVEGEPHDSNYKAKETSELDASKWEGAEA